MTSRFKIIALALGLAVASGTIAQASPSVTNAPVKSQHSHVTKHAVSAAQLRKHRLHAAHLRHMQKLHETRLRSRHHHVKTVKMTAPDHRATKNTNTVLAHRAVAKPATVIR
jgi:hypothetical protein